MVCPQIGYDVDGVSSDRLRKFDNFPSVIKSGGEVHKTRDFRGNW